MRIHDAARVIQNKPSGCRAVGSIGSTAALGVADIASEAGYDAFCVNVLDAVDDYLARLDAEVSARRGVPDITLSEVEEAAFLTHARDAPLHVDP